MGKSTAELNYECKLRTMSLEERDPATMMDGDDTVDIFFSPTDLDGVARNSSVWDDISSGHELDSGISQSSNHQKSVYLQQARQQIRRVQTCPSFFSLLDVGVGSPRDWIDVPMELGPDSDMDLSPGAQRSGSIANICRHSVDERPRGSGDSPFGFGCSPLEASEVPRMRGQDSDGDHQRDGALEQLKQHVERGSSTHDEDYAAPIRRAMSHSQLSKSVGNAANTKVAPLGVSGQHSVLCDRILRHHALEVSATEPTYFSLPDHTALRSEAVNSSADCIDPEPEFGGNYSANSMRRIKSSPVELSSLRHRRAGAFNSKQVRMQKKAESARLSRFRKKEYIRSLEEKVARLTARLTELEATGTSFNDASTDDSHDRIHAGIKADIERLMKQSADSKQIDEAVSKFVRQSRERQSRVDFHMGRATDSLVPGLQLKFALWCMSQDESFFESSPIWKDVLGQQIGLARDQLEQLKEFRAYISEAKDSIFAVQKRMKRLRESIGSHLSARHEHLDELRRILTPEQVATFTLWVENNPLMIIFHNAYKAMRVATNRVSTWLRKPGSLPFIVLPTQSVKF